MATKNKHANALLGRLAPSELAVVEHDLEPVSLAFKQTLHEQGRAIRYLYFPTSAVISLVTLMAESGETIETGTIGSEGLVGVSVVLGATVASGRALCQVPGGAQRIAVEPFLANVARFERLRTSILLYTNALVAMVAQTAGCNRAHSAEARMARWLLMTQDRVEGSEFPMTQEFLGQMLGVRRPAINLAGQTLQRAGLIKYSRGRITILDRVGLEAASCECYEHIRLEFARALSKR